MTALGRWALPALLAVPLLAGCGDKPVRPQTGTIPLKAWCVLGPGESPGNRSNRGCRLMTHEIQQYIRHLQNSSYILGANIRFAWQIYELDEAQDPALLPYVSRTRDYRVWHQTVVFNYWTEGHINIYFVGNVEYYPPAQPDAITVDPSQAWRLDPDDRPWILINDTGYGSENGITYDPLTCTIPANVLVHEMVHYLARFESQCFGVEPNRRCYDSGEHIANVLDYNILRYGYACDIPYPPYLPGRWKQPETERGRIWARVYAGQWPYP